MLLKAWGRTLPLAFVLVAVLVALETAAAEDALHPAGTRTGVPAADRVLAAIESGQPLTSVLQYGQFACTTELEGIGGPPLCPEGVSAGTLVPAVFSGGCSTNTYAQGDSEITRIFGVLEPGYRLYGLARYTGDPGGWDITHVLLVARSSALWDYQRYFLGGDGIVGSAACAGTAAGDWALETQVVVGPSPAAPGPPATGTSAVSADSRQGGPHLVAGAAILLVISAGLAAVNATRRRRS